MPLLSLWATNPEAIIQLSIEQIVATAGNGKLLDGSECAQELRDFLAQVQSEKLSEYADYCLTTSFPKGGLVLQDVVNELGRRLDYQVENGRYQGVVNAVGYDGIWKTSEGNDIIIEVKTTDAYRISLDNIAVYREKLRDSGRVRQKTSILIVVGREDTGELEAQVRGSRHAWDMRLISIDALQKLVKIKESTEAGVTSAKIRSVLVPMEYTRLDALVDVMFTAAKDVETTVESEKTMSDEDEIIQPSGTSESDFTELQSLQSKRADIMSALSQKDKLKFVKRSRALYWDATHTHRVACTVSKRYAEISRNSPPYWYAYHTNWDKFLSEGESGSIVLGCMDLDVAFVLPLEIIRSHLSELNTTGQEEGRQYWHLKILEPKPGEFALHLPKIAGQLPLDDFIVNLK